MRTMAEQLPDKRVLIVDDDESIRDFLTLLFEGAGFQVRTAASAEQGIEALTQQHDPVIMLDIMMPGMTGLEALGKLKAISPHSSVMMLTAHADRDNAIKALNLGAFKFFVKPLEPEKHQEVIESANEAVARYGAALDAARAVAARRVRRRRMAIGAAIGAPLVAAMVALVVTLYEFRAREEAAKKEPLGESQKHSILVTFGLKDAEATAWDGNVTLSDGNVESLQGWCFTGRDKIVSNTAWECSTEESVPDPRSETGKPKGMTHKGILLSLDAPVRATVTVR
ncbi:MAG: response regulator, partial [Planctomycetes bacterium]|nr:response regulator [Planctomycetota bacterium]